MLDECVAIAVTNSMCTDLPVVHHFPYFVDQSSWCTLRSAFCDYFMSTVFSFDVLLKWARRNDAVCIFESTKIPEIGGRGRRVGRHGAGLDWPEEKDIFSNNILLIFAAIKI